MKASETQFLKLLGKPLQFEIPIYQRTYSWTENECQQLWDDIISAGSDNETTTHFIGSIVYIESGLSQVSQQSPLLVIDGQQRLTTVTILLAALAEILKSGEANYEPVEGFSATKIRGYYLLNELESNEKRYKLILTQTDEKTLKAIVEQNELPAEKSLRVEENHKFFKGKITACNGDFAVLCNGLNKLCVVDIALSRQDDNPQLIFESMNSTGRKLSQADLTRNFILMGLEQESQTSLYEHYWRPMEIEFGQKNYDSYFDTFIRHYLTIKNKEIPNKDDVYETFKKLAHKDKRPIPEFLTEIRTYASYYCAIALGAEKDTELGIAFRDLHELKVEVAYPFLLEAYRDYKGGTLGKEELIQIVRLVESYVFRRAVCNIPTPSLNKTFATLTRTLNKSKYLEGVMAHLQMLPTYRRFPKDDEFKRCLKTRNLYKFRSCSYWLRRLENHENKEPVDVNNLTIEHIMPQTLTPAWEKLLGDDWQSIYEEHLHTLGNLTLTGYNPEYSNHTFKEKCNMKEGFKDSRLWLNKGLGELESWGKIEIDTRADELSSKAVEVWCAPQLTKERLDPYRKPIESTAEYSRADHPNLSSTNVGELFDAFRLGVLELDSCIKEEFFKTYIAYKAETNFVNVVPRATDLRLFLNMRFTDVYDPEGKCKDVTNIGRWSNGDVKIKLTSMEQLPYIMGLVRQSLEQQLGDPET